MALSITFTCNTIYDENDNAIDAYYQAYHPRTNTWNDVRFSEYNQYSFNAGDGDFLTQSGELLTNDEILICLWISEDDSEDRTGLKDRFCTFSIIHDGETSTYVIDPQLIPKTNPICGFSLSTYSGTINHTIYAMDYSRDNYSWSFNDEYFYHERYVESELIWDSVGVNSIRYNWDYDSDSTNYIVDTEYSYEEINDYNVYQRVTNYYGLSTECNTTLRIKYNPPIPYLSFNYVDPIHTTESTDVNASIQDIDSRIDNIHHRLYVRDRDTDELISDTLIEENTTLDYSYNRTIEVLQKHYFAQVIYWNDGYDSLTINYEKELPITNWIPNVTIEKIDTSDMIKTFHQTSSDTDGDIVQWEWKIHYIPPFEDTLYNEVYSYITDVGDDHKIEFTTGGKYKAEIIITDDYGSTSNAELLFEISPSCINPEVYSIGGAKFIFPKNMIV